MIPLIAEEAQWDFFLFLEGYIVPFPSRFALEPSVLENLKQLYKDTKWQEQIVSCVC